MRDEEDCSERQEASPAVAGPGLASVAFPGREARHHRTRGLFAPVKESGYGTG